MTTVLSRQLKNLVYRARAGVGGRRSEIGGQRSGGGDLRSAIADKIG